MLDPRRESRRRVPALAFALVVAAATLAVAACDDPPTAAHPLVHFYEGVTYLGRSFPANICPNPAWGDWRAESWNITTIGGDSMIVKQVVRYRPDMTPETRTAGFRFVMRDSRLEALHGPIPWFVQGTATADGFDAQFRVSNCVAPTIYGSNDTVATVHFVLRY